MRSTAQVVVIGGGAVGASCLYHLTCSGVTDCLLIEKDELTSGSTWHAAGNIPTYANSWLGMRAGNYAWDLYKDLEHKVDAPITYRHTGAFWPAHTQDRMDLFHHLTGVSKSAGFDLCMLSPSEMEDKHPYYRAGKNIIGGIFDPYEGDIDPSQLTQALAKGARSAGAEVARFTEVTGIKRNADNEWIVQTNKGDVLCETIVNASGFYGDAIAGFTSGSLPIAVLEHQYVVTDALDALKADKSLFPLVRDPDIRFYCRREGESLLLGSYGHPGRLAFDKGLPDEFAHSLFEDSVDDILDLIEETIEHIPLLAEAGLQRFVNGPIGYTPDALPLCGPAYGLPNFYHACGIQIGITHSAAAGKAIAEWVTESETEWDYSSWDPRRFGEWANRDYAQKRIVELYDLQYAIPFPHRIIHSGRPLQCTPLYSTLKDKGAVFGQIAGWERAFWFDKNGSNDFNDLSFRNTEPWFEPVRKECIAVRDSVGIMDHGGFTKFEVSGTGAAAWLDTVFCTKLPKTGRIKLAYLLTPNGKIWSEATVARIETDRFLLCGPTVTDLRDHDWLRDKLPADGSVSLKRGSDYDAALMVMGPQSRALLSELITDPKDISSEAMPWMSVSKLEIAGCDTLAKRVSYVGELGWELHLQSSDLTHVYGELSQAGAKYGLVDFGSYALNSMRLEKAYHAWGADFGTEYTLFDAGLSNFADLNKTDFIGRDAVINQSKNKPDWRFVRLIVDIDDADAMASDPVFFEDQCVGFVSSGGSGFRTGKCIALAYIENAVNEKAEQFEVEVLGRKCKASVSPNAFYDPDNHRLRSI